MNASDDRNDDTPPDWCALDDFARDLADSCRASATRARQLAATARSPELRAEWARSAERWSRRAQELLAAPVDDEPEHPLLESASRVQHANTVVYFDAPSPCAVVYVEQIDDLFLLFWIGSNGAPPYDVCEVDRGAIHGGTLEVVVWAYFSPEEALAAIGKRWGVQPDRTKIRGSGCA